MTEVWFRAMLIVIGSVFGSGGFWAFLQVIMRRRDTRRDAMTQLMMGLAQAKITEFGLEYIDRGSVTHEEYENLLKYLYEPYKALGGNGSAQRIMTVVSNLPFRPRSDHSGIFRNREEGWTNNVQIVRQDAIAE